MTDHEAEVLNRALGTDLISITMNFRHGRATASETMERINDRVQLAYKLGRKAEARARREADQARGG